MSNHTIPAATIDRSDFSACQKATCEALWEHIRARLAQAHERLLVVRALLESIPAPAGEAHESERIAQVRAQVEAACRSVKAAHDGAEDGVR